MLKRDFRITESDTGANLNVRASRLLAIFQDAATDDCENNLGFGRKVLHEQYGGFWVVSRTSVYQDAPLCTGKYTLTTWHAFNKGPVWQRGYIVQSQTGEIVVRAVTQWTILSEEMPRRILLIKDAPAPDISPYEMPPLKRFRMDSLMLSGQRTISLSDLDENRHCNNALAANIIEDAAAYPVEDPLPRLCELHIHYAGEARFGDMLDIMTGSDGAYAYVQTSVGTEIVHGAAVRWQYD